MLRYALLRIAVMCFPCFCIAVSYYTFLRLAISGTYLSTQQGVLCSMARPEYMKCQHQSSVAHPDCIR